MATEKSYNRVNWEARKTPISAKNLNQMDEGIYINRQAIQELQSAVYESNGEVIEYIVTATVKNRFELPNVPEEGAYYYVTSTNSIYKGINTHYELVQSNIKQIYGGGAK